MKMAVRMNLWLNFGPVAAGKPGPRQTWFCPYIRADGVCKSTCVAKADHGMKGSATPGQHTAEQKQRVLEFIRNSEGMCLPVAGQGAPHF